MTRAKQRASLLSTVMLAGLAGCGDAGEPAARVDAAPTSTVPAAPVAATPEATAKPKGPTTRLTVTTPRDRIIFDRKRLRARPGTVVITMINKTVEVHNISLKGNGVFEVGPNARGGRSVVSSVVKPGRYTYYCSIIGHTGQRGTLIVG